MLCSREWVRERVAYWWRSLKAAYTINDKPYGSLEYQPDWWARFPRVAFSNRLTSTAGQARWRKCEVKFSLHFMNTIEQERYDQTIGHEVAHIWANTMHDCCVGHGSQWKSVMRRIGLEPSRCHQYESAVTKRRQNRVHMTCGCPEGCMLGPQQYKKVQRGTARYRCLKCNKRIEDKVSSGSFADMFRIE